MNENLLTGEANRQYKEETIKKQKQELEDIKIAFNYIFSTSQGILLGKWIIEQCGFFNSNFVIGDNGIISINSLCKEARRNIYLELRSYLNSETLINLEIK